MSCPVLETKYLGSKWALLIVEEIAFGRFTGFNEVLRRTAMTPRTLSRKVKRLEESGLIQKLGGPETKYQLTEKGKDIHRLVTEIKRVHEKWGDVPGTCESTPCTECVRARTG